MYRLFPWTEGEIVREVFFCKLSQSIVLDECNLKLSSDRECGYMGLCWYWITAGRKAQNLSTQSTTLSAEALQHRRNMAYSLFVPEQLRNWSMHTHTHTHTHTFIIDLPITAETAYRASMQRSLIPTAYQCHYLRPDFHQIAKVSSVWHCVESCPLSTGVFLEAWIW